MSTCSLLLKLQTVKLLYRWYLTPKQIPDVLCLKGCGSEARYIHCWWNYPVIWEFWIKICYTNFEITAYWIRQRLEIVLLHLWETELLRSLDKPLPFYWPLSRQKSLLNKRMTRGLQYQASVIDYGRASYGKDHRQDYESTRIGYKSCLEDVWSAILWFLENLQILPPTAVSNFLAKSY